MEQILDFLKKLLRIERDIGQITRPITKIQNDLEKLATREQTKAQDNTVKAAKLLAESEQRRAAASEAQQFAKGLPSFGAAAK